MYSDSKCGVLHHLIGSTIYYSVPTRGGRILFVRIQGYISGVY